MLTSWKVDFEAIDVEVQPEAMQTLHGHGITRVPAVIVGDHAVHGWNPAAVAGLVGVTYDDALALPLPQLQARLDTILRATQRAIMQVPAQHLHMRTPGRDRSVHQLAYHLFRVGQAYGDAMEQGYLPEAWFEEQPPPDMPDMAAIAQYGEKVRERLHDWCERPAAFDGTVETYYGPQQAAAFFERTVWHTAQHLRQLYALLDQMGVTPEKPLAGEDFAGLPLPQNVW